MGVRNLTDDQNFPDSVKIQCTVDRTEAWQFVDEVFEIGPGPGLGEQGAASEVKDGQSRSSLRGSIMLCTPLNNSSAEANMLHQRATLKSTGLTSRLQADYWDYCSFVTLAHFNRKTGGGAEAVVHF